MHVTINGRDPDKLNTAAAEIRRTYDVEVIPVAADITTPGGQADLLAACPEPDILVSNNAGPPFRDFRDLDREALLRGVLMNMITPIELITRVIDPMTHRGFGRIINITSVGVKMPLTGLDLSSGSRAGLTAFVAGVARSVADRNVTINNLLPGYFDTDRLRAGFAAAAQRSGTTTAETEAEWRDSVPARRFGLPSELGSACAFLCSTQAGFITGQNLLVDGGLFPGTF